MKARKRLHKSSNWAYATIIAFGLIDVFAKHVATKFPTNIPYPNSGIIDLIHFQNTGIAMSIPLPSFISVPLSAALIVYIGQAAWVNSTKQVRIACAMILTGAFSNIAERIALGHVTDYLLLFGRSAINIADILILLGIILFIRYNKDIN